MFIFTVNEPRQVEAWLRLWPFVAKKCYGTDDCITNIYKEFRPTLIQSPSLPFDLPRAQIK